MVRFPLKFLVREVRAVLLYLVACYLVLEFFASSSSVGVLGSSFAPFVEASFVFDLVSSGHLVEASFVFDLGPSFGLLVEASSVLFQGPFVLVVVAYSVSVSGQVASAVGSEVSLAFQNQDLLVS